MPASPPVVPESVPGVPESITAVPGTTTVTLLVTPFQAPSTRSGPTQAASSLFRQLYVTVPLPLLSSTVALLPPPAPFSPPPHPA